MISQAVVFALALLMAVPTTRRRRVRSARGGDAAGTADSPEQPVGGGDDDRSARPDGARTPWARERRAAAWTARGAGAPAEAAARQMEHEQDLDPDDAIVESLFPDDEPEPVAKRQITARGAVLVGARVVTGVVGLAVAAVAITASSLLPLPTVQSQPVSVLVTPVLTAQQVVCAGAVLRLSDETGQGATIPSPVGSGPSLDYGASAGDADAVPLGQSDAGTGGSFDAPLLVSTPPGDPDSRVLVSGAQSEQVSEGDYAGLAARRMRARVPRRHGSPRARRRSAATTLLTMSNPTEVPATVDIEIFDESGPVSAPGTSGIIVPPNGRQRALRRRVRTRPRVSHHPRHEHRRPGGREPPAIGGARPRRGRS